jgi:dihydroflavonol-4-reductase
LADVLVTGASGHIGANLVRALLARGRSVRVLVHTEGRARALDGLDVERLAGDVRDVAAVRRACAGVEVVHHLAAVISIDGDLGGLVPSVNVGGAATVAEAALAAGVRRMVHMCSVHAFAQDETDALLDETCARAIGPAHPAYDRSKAAGERAVREVIGRGLDAVLLHPTGVIGPCDFGPSRMGQVLLDLARRRMPALVEGGYDFVDARDVTEAALAAADEQRGRRGESYLLAGGWSSVRGVAEAAERATGVPPPRLDAPMWLARAGAPLVAAFHRVAGGMPLFTPESLRALRCGRNISSAKARRDLGWSPRPLVETVADTYAWFRAAGVLG